MDIIHNTNKAQTSFLLNNTLAGTRHNLKFGMFCRKNPFFDRFYQIRVLRQSDGDRCDLICELYAGHTIACYRKMSTKTDIGLIALQNPNHGLRKSTRSLNDFFVTSPRERRPVKYFRLRAGIAVSQVSAGRGQRICVCVCVRVFFYIFRISRV